LPLAATMVFSLFKKPEKMPVRPGVKPKTADHPATRSRLPETGSSQADTAASIDDDLESLDFTGIQLEEESDPLEAFIEQAAIAFANDHEDEAGAILIDALKAAAGDKSTAAERTWLMLFDLYQLTRDRDGFAKLELDYARAFEKQPPVWKDSPEEAAAAASGIPTIIFKGDLVAANSAALATAEQGVMTAPLCRLDLSRVKQADREGCKGLVKLLNQAQRTKHRIELAGVEGLAGLLETALAGDDKSESCIRALLACYQQLGRQDDFENLAVDLAVLFEISPPSWEPVNSPKPGKPAAAKPKPVGVVGDIYYLFGEIRGGKFDGLDAYLSDRETAVLDLSAVERIDFTSAGTLLSILSPHWQRGVPITVRHPHRLVAELLTVMGMAEMVEFDFVRK
jgi:ABC-type transporter Mla MlaB component